MSGAKKGQLYIVATPIGNLSDITIRALDVLKSVDMIACEDTRNTIKILNHYDIKSKLVSYHEHNKYDKLDELIKELLDGKDIAAVSDAGTPIINDPGYELVKSAIDHGIEVTSIPGPCACINAIVASGIESREFIYIGFLPDDKKSKIGKLSSLVDRTETIVVYASKSEIKKVINCIYDVFPHDREICICREMTKIHEEYIRGTVSDVRDTIKDRDLLGEFVVVIKGIDKDELDIKKKESWQGLSIREHVDYYIQSGMTEKEAMKKVSKDRSIDKNDVYKEVKVKEL